MKLIKSEYLDLPHGNTVIWRYISHWKLKDLFKTSSIFFPNANKLTDEYEVSIPSSTIKNKILNLKKSGLSSRDLDEEIMLFNWQNNPMKDLVLINCWSINKHESYALWKIYLGGEKNGIAIKTTISKLRRSIENGKDKYPENFFIGKVKYKKHLKQDELSRFEIITTKKPFYDFEKELRVFILNYPLAEGGEVPPYDMKQGRTVKIDIDELIHEVYISPFANEDYKLEVQKIVNGINTINERYVIKDSEIKDQ